MNTSGSKTSAYKVLFNGEYILAVNKKPGILVIPTPKKERWTLTSILSEDFGQTLYPCHRLDKSTSGIILYAKDKATQQKIMQQFRNRRIEKKYIALALGKLPKKGRIKSIVKDKYNPFKKEKFAITLYRTLKHCRKFSVIEVKTLTGRTNQIRIQFAQIGHPLLGERKYAIAKKIPVKFSRPALHAYTITFIHPITRQEITLKADLWPDMAEKFKKEGINLFNKENA